MPPRTEPDFKAKYLRQLPSIGKLLEHTALEEALQTCPRVLLTKAISDTIAIRKKYILDAADESQLKDLDLSTESFINEAADLAAIKSRMSLRRAINATGDIFNRTMGKAPLNESAQRALQDVSIGYANLAVDRNTHVESLLTYLTGAESGLVVNNNAAAVMLILNTVADGKEVIVSRGQLMENDGFRISDAIDRSGAKLVSVGATNKARLRDYSDAINENTGAILRVHKSDYRIAGFSQDVSLKELVTLGKRHGFPPVGVV